MVFITAAKSSEVRPLFLMPLWGTMPINNPTRQKPGRQGATAPAPACASLQHQEAQEHQPLDLELQGLRRGDTMMLRQDLN